MLLHGQVGEESLDFGEAQSSAWDCVFWLDMV